jgi:hypothetical protein
MLKGTAAHYVFEQCLLEDCEPQAYVNVAINEAEGYVFTQEMADDIIVPAIAAWRELVAQYDIDQFEPEVPAYINDNIGGTPDLVWRSRCGKYGGVTDLKTGAGHQVEALENQQNLFSGATVLYGTSDAQDLLEGIEVFVSSIIQPNNRGLDVLRNWECSAARLTDKFNELIPIWDRSNEPNPEPTAGTWCTFCRKAPTCPAKTGEAHAALLMDPEDLDTLADALDMVKSLDAWIKSVEKAAHAQLEVGSEIRGWKLVPKRATAKWKDEAAALEALRRRLGGIKKVTKTTLLTPTQITKVAKDAGKEVDLTELVEKLSSGTTIAPASDKREAVVSSRAFKAALDGIS